MTRRPVLFAMAYMALTIAAIAVLSSLTAQPPLAGPLSAKLTGNVTDRGARGDGTTDDTGHYVIGSLPTGRRYRVTAETRDYPDDPQFFNFVREYWNNRTQQALADPVSLPDLTPVTGIDFHLELGGAISGTVTDEQSGQPLSGVRVNANRVGQQGCCGNGDSTDQNGEVVTTVNSRDMPTSFRVVATLPGTASNGNPDISTPSDTIVVSTGLTTQRALSLNVTTPNIEGWNYDSGTTTPATIFNILLADQFGRGMINEAPFQQVVRQVTDAIDADPATRSLLSRLLAEVRARGSLAAQGAQEKRNE